MAILQWDQTGERLYETGVDRGVLYIPNGVGLYNDGYAWNGLTAVTESPSGAEVTPIYADNIKYLNLLSTEEFGATIEAFTYPEEFGQCDGTVLASPGVLLGQQSRKTFGLSYRTRVGNDLDGTDHGYKLHLLYGCLAAPSEKAYATINDSPEAISFSWEVSTTAVNVPNYKPTSLMVIDSTVVVASELTDLETILYGAAAVEPRLPTPTEIIAMFTGTIIVVRLTGANAPTYNSTTKVVTLPTVTGITWYINGEERAPGDQPALTVGQTAVVEAVANAGYQITGDDDWTYDY